MPILVLITALNYMIGESVMLAPVGIALGITAAASPDIPDHTKEIVEK